MATTLDSLERQLSAIAARLDQPPTRFLSVDLAARYASLSSESVRRLISAGKLTPYRPVRGRIVIDRRQLDALILGATVQPRTGRGRNKKT